MGNPTVIPYAARNGSDEPNSRRPPEKSAFKPQRETTSSGPEQPPSVGNMADIGAPSQGETVLARVSELLIKSRTKGTRDS